MLTLPIDPKLIAHHERIGDPLADPVADLVFRKKPAGKDLLAFAEAEAAVGDEACAAFIAAAHQVPAWVDFSIMQPGAELFLRNSLASVAVFVLHSLLLTYIPVNMARVLIHTGRLRGQLLRRLYETATMVRDVLEPGALKPGNAGWRSVLRVRILHALVRRSILRGGRWTFEMQPINQTELAQTGTLFGFVVADGLERLGLPVSGEEKDSYQHLWRYANWLQGVPEVLQATSHEDEGRLHRQLAEQFYFPDANSFALIDALLGGLDMQAPFFMPRPVLSAFSASLLDKTVAERIGLKADGVPKAMLGLLQTALPIAGLRYRLVPALRQLELEVGKQYFNDLIKRGLDGVAADYAAQGAA